MSVAMGEAVSSGLVQDTFVWEKDCMRSEVLDQRRLDAVQLGALTAGFGNEAWSKHFTAAE